MVEGKNKRIISIYQQKQIMQIIQIKIQINKIFRHHNII